MSSPTTTAGVPEGFVSVEARKKLTGWTIGLGVLCLCALFLGPYLIMIPFIVDMVRSSRSGPVHEVHEGDVLDGTLWYPAPVADDRGGRALHEVDLDEADPPREVLHLGDERVSMLTHGNGLWAVADGRVGWWDGEEMTWTDASTPEPRSRPFMHEGSLHVISRNTDGFVMQRWSDSGWKTGSTIPLSEEPRVMPEAFPLQAIEVDGTLHLFLAHGSTVLHHAGLPPTPANAHDWIQVPGGNVALPQMRPVDHQGTPALFLMDRASGYGEIVIWGYELTDGGWEILDGRNAHDAEQFGAWAAGDGWLLVWSDSRGTVRSVRSGAPDEDIRSHGAGGPEERIFRHMVFIFLAAMGFIFGVPFLASLVLSIVMKRTRTGTTPERVPLASLGRRAWAKAVDAIILYAPFAVAYAFFFRLFFEIPQDGGPPPAGFFLPYLFFFLGAVWWFAGLFVMSWTEGRWGATPGKWLLRIRVVNEDRMPPGFPMAIVRNLVLWFVDLQMAFLVGIALAAMTAKQQRVGDMLAKTIVVPRDALDPEDPA